MNRKWRKYVIIGILLFDLCLFVGGAVPFSDAGMIATPLTKSLMLSKGALHGSVVKAHTSAIGNFVVAAVILLTMTLL